MKETLRSLLPYVRNYRRQLIWGIVALVLRNVASVAIPLVIGYSVDRLAAHFTMERAVYMSGGLIALTALKGLFQYAMRVILIGLSRDIEFDLRNDLFGNLISLPTEFYARFRTGDIMARATNDLNAVRMMLGPGIMYTADTALTAVLAVAVMASVDWKLSLVTLLPAPIVTFLVMRFGRYVHRQFRTIQSLFADISSRVQENLSAVRVIRAYVQEDAEEKRFAALNEDYITENLKMARVSGLFLPILHSFTGFSFLLVLWYGGMRLLQGEITLGNFLMFNVYLGVLVWPMVAMGWVVNLMQRGSASMLRINQLLQEVPTVASPASPLPMPRPFRGEIVLEHVGLRFAETEVLKDVSLEMPAGSTIAIVGPTGCGKSSVAHLLPRLHDPTSGRVTLDGVDLRSLNLRELRQTIGFVPQESFLFSATLAENISFGVPGASDDQIEAAARMAGLAPDIEGFPNGYQTMIGERGLTLSGGQKQRTAIARAILREPGILVLDDALSSVDTETETRILDALRGVVESRTTIVISHRASTIRNADRIFVMEGGEVVEEGNHEVLLALNGHYASFYRKQLLEEELESI